MNTESELSTGQLAAKNFETLTDEIKKEDAIKFLKTGALYDDPTKTSSSIELLLPAKTQEVYNILQQRLVEVAPSGIYPNEDTNNELIDCVMNLKDVEIEKVETDFQFISKMLIKHFGLAGYFKTMPDSQKDIFLNLAALYAVKYVMENNLCPRTIDLINNFLEATYPQYCTPEKKFLNLKSNKAYALDQPFDEFIQSKSQAIVLLPVEPFEISFDEKFIVEKAKKYALQLLEKLKYPILKSEQDIHESTTLKC